MWWIALCSEVPIEAKPAKTLSLNHFTRDSQTHVHTHKRSSLFQVSENLPVFYKCFLYMSASKQERAWHVLQLPEIWGHLLASGVFQQWVTVTGKLKHVLHTLDSLIELLLWSLEDDDTGTHLQLQQDTLVEAQDSQYPLDVSLRTL